MTRSKSSQRIFEPKWLLAIAFLAVGLFCGIMGTYLFFNINLPVGGKFTSRSNQFPYINPLLSVDIGGSQFGRESSLQIELDGEVNNAIRDSKVQSASIYFRDIDPGLWVSINEQATFSPGRLLKIPIMIAYYKLAETDSSILDNTLTFNYSDAYTGGPDPVVGNVKKLELGQSYTVDDLINRMIVNSDNDAANMLYDNIDKSTLDEIFSDLGISFKEDKDNPDVISLKQYSLFYRVLYNSTYLNRKYSSKALAVLVQSPEDIGIFSGIPKNVQSANRYGSRTIGNIFELYDCGIAYYPGHPYLLCVTAKGTSLKNIEQFFSAIGEKVYSDIKYQYPY